MVHPVKSSTSRVTGFEIVPGILKRNSCCNAVSWSLFSAQEIHCGYKLNCSIFTGRKGKWCVYSHMYSVHTQIHVQIQQVPFGKWNTFNGSGTGQSSPFRTSVPHSIIYQYVNCGWSALETQRLPQFEWHFNIRPLLKIIYYYSRNGWGRCWRSTHKSIVTSLTYGRAPSPIVTSLKARIDRKRWWEKKSEDNLYSNAFRRVHASCSVLQRKFDEPSAIYFALCWILKLGFHLFFFLFSSSYFLLLFLLGFHCSYIVVCFLKDPSERLPHEIHLNV